MHRARELRWRQGRLIPGGPAVVERLLSSHCASLVYIQCAKHPLVARTPLKLRKLRNAIACNAHLQVCSIATLVCLVRLAYPSSRLGVAEGCAACTVFDVLSNCFGCRLKSSAVKSCNQLVTPSFLYTAGWLHYEGLPAVCGRDCVNNHFSVCSCKACLTPRC